LDSITINHSGVKYVDFDRPFSTTPNYSVSLGSADIHCDCAKDMGFGDSIIKPFKGNCFGMVGIQHSDEKFDGKTAYGEYLESKLKQPLIAGQKYEVHLAYRKEPRGANGINILGIKFTNEPFTTDERDYKGEYHECDILISEEPIVEESRWLDSTYTFIAKGGEEFITIGRFIKAGIAKKTARANGKSGHIGYLIDDVSVIPKED
jgi:hypothetical protein